MLIPELVPAIIASREDEYERKLRAVENFVVRIQIDIMDGQFVEDVTIGASTVEKFGTTVSRDIHLMVKDPIAHIGEFSRIGVDQIIFHAETGEMEKVIEEIKSLGHRTGVALNIETPVSILDRVIEGLDSVQLMAAEPGFSGQKFNPLVLPKILSLRERYPALPIAVCGGVSQENAGSLVDAGASVLLVGHHLFASSDIKTYIENLNKTILEQERYLENGV